MVRGQAYKEKPHRKLEHSSSSPDRPAVSSEQRCLIRLAAEVTITCCCDLDHSKYAGPRPSRSSRAPESSRRILLREGEAVSGMPRSAAEPRYLPLCFSSVLHWPHADAMSQLVRQSSVRKPVATPPSAAAATTQCERTARRLFASSVARLFVSSDSATVFVASAMTMSGRSPGSRRVNVSTV